MNATINNISANNPLNPQLCSRIKRLKLCSADKRYLSQVLSEPISYISNPLFRRPKSMAVVMAKIVVVLPGISLNIDEEKTLFLQMNYARYRLSRLHKELLGQKRWSSKTIKQLLEWNYKQLEARSKIVTGNMGLVLAMAKRVHYSGVEFSDLISEGSMALLRSTNKFDCSRGFKFSTYACRAILKAFSRTAKQCYRQCQRFQTLLENTVETDDMLTERRRQNHMDWVDEVRNIMQNNLADLTNIEQSVMRFRFSLNDSQTKPLTLREVGAKLSLTKERIRQIQNNALAKLRVVAEDRMASI